MSTEFDSTLTHNVVVSAFPIIAIETEWYRLIPSRFPPVSLYQRIAANDRWDEIAEIESLTNPRLRSKMRQGVDDQAPCTGHKFQNWNHAPFAYPNPEGSYLFREAFACLEMADDLQTALGISVRRREIFLERTQERAAGLDMRVLKTPVKGNFLDMRSLSGNIDKKTRWAIGDDVLAFINQPDVKIDGILYRCQERPSATCIAVLRGEALGKAVQAQHFRYAWDGAKITSLYAFDMEGRVIQPEGLSKPENVLAA